MKKLMMVALVGVTLLGAGCTANVRARVWGGTADEKLPQGRKLVNVTWKDADLWILTKPMSKDDVAETYEFIESSSFGVMQGKVIIRESK